MTGLVKEIEQRRAYRALKEDKIPDDIIRRIMMAATYAPSCFNNQSWRFVVVTGMNYAKFHGDDRIDLQRHLIENNAAIPKPIAGQCHQV